MRASEFNDRVALVTGASRGIGRGIALALGRAGATVVVNYRTREADAGKVASEIKTSGGKARVWKADVADRVEAPKMVEGVAAEFGRLDILVNNAGVLQDGPLMMMSDEQWDAVVKPALDGAFLCSRAAMRPMIERRSGVILNVSSVSWRIGVSGQTNYATAKAGLVGFTRALAAEVVRFGIRVNAIAPGLVETEMSEQVPEKMRKKILEVVPMGRAATVEEVVAPAMFLLGDGAAYITGKVLDVDGGMS
ncbi:MAG: 3-oxoacyl-acyl-carrier protein [Planctomycetota bacterium]|nr:MAG: 3-oxoacyl-acyl-carrier protein [Planctomycetota bacterium]